MSKLTAVELFPPGEILADELEARGWTQAEFAAIIDRPAQFVNEVIAGKKEITRESAAQFEAALGVSAQFWLSLQDEYLLWKQEQDPQEQEKLNQVHLRAQLHEAVPLAEFRKRGYITSEAPEEQEQEILKFFGIRSLGEIAQFRFAARRKSHSNEKTLLQNLWVACVRAAAQDLHVGSYSPSVLSELYPSLARSTGNPAGLGSIQGRLAEVGVKIVFVEAFPGGKIDGCAFLEGATPVIGISGRGKRLDKVFFTIMHELAHVLLGHLNASEVLLDDLSTSGEGIEKEADELASKSTWGNGLAAPPRRITASWIAEQANLHAVHPILVTGRLQYDGLLSWKSSLANGAPSALEGLGQWESAIPSTSL